MNGLVTLPNAIIATTEAGTIALINPPTGGGSHSWAVTAPLAGAVQLGGNNVLPPAAIMVLGQTGSANLGTMNFNGFNSTVAGLGIAPGSTGAPASQIVQNNAAAGSNSILTFAGNATPSVFAGTVRDSGTAGTGTLALVVTQGSLTLNNTTGVAPTINSYSGGTTINGGTLIAANGTNGSATGTGPVVVNSGGRLGGTGTIVTTAPNTVSTSGTGILGPGTSIGTLNITGNVTLGGVFEAEVSNAPASDLLNVTGSVTIGGTMTLPGTNTYLNSATYNLITATTRTGTFTNFNQGAFVPGTTLFVNYTPTSVQLVPVPEPATILAIAAAAAGLMGWRRRLAARAALAV